MIKWTRERSCEVPEDGNITEDNEEDEKKKCGSVKIKIVRKHDNDKKDNKPDLDDFWPRRKRTDVTRYYYHF